MYHLIQTNGYLRDQDKPYRYDSLGWFTSPYAAKGTKEWQLMRYIINTRDDILGYENETEVGVLGPYGLSDQNPTLTIVEHRLLA